MPITNAPIPQPVAAPQASAEPVAVAQPSPIANAAAIVGEPTAAPGAPATDAVAGGPKRRGRKPSAGRGPSKKADYPGELDENGNRVTLLTTIPEDYNPKIHKPLKKDDFTNEETFLRARAQFLRQTADKLDAKAKTLETLGTGEQRAAASKLLKMHESFATLIASLKDSGVDVDALLKSASVDGTE